jgi:hypothetical protein
MGSEVVEEFNRLGALIVRVARLPIEVGYAIYPLGAFHGAEGISQQLCRRRTPSGTPFLTVVEVATTA